MITILVSVALTIVVLFIGIVIGAALTATNKTTISVRKEPK